MIEGPAGTEWWATYAELEFVRYEIDRLYGDRPLAPVDKVAVSSDGHSVTVTISDEEWAGGVWRAVLGQEIAILSSSGGYFSFATVESVSGHDIVLRGAVFGIEPGDSLFSSACAARTRRQEG